VSQDIMTGSAGGATQAPMLMQLLRLGPSPAQLGLVFALAAALTLAAGVLMWAMRPNMVPLYTSLAERDAGDVVTTLQARDIPFEVDERTGMILVPSSEVREIRMALAADGLVQNESMGLELLREDQSVGTSQFMERARYQHALETELSRTIARMRGVEAARVHLAIPKQTSFVRSRSRPSASVMLKLTPGRALDNGQVQGIANLVASSVPYLELARVAVVDQFGRLLTRDSVDGELALSNRQFEYKRSFERTYSERVEELLFPIVGAGRVRAQVHAELDFSQAERREEAFTGAPEKMRSEQVQDQRGAPIGALGVPGALTNQPPEGGTLGDAEAPAESAPGGSYSKNTTRNYELDKTVVHTRTAPGRLTRLSIAVLVDDRVSVGKKGKETRTPREQAELDSITGLVKEAVGFDEERGDSVVVINRSFEAPEAIEPPPEPPVWESDWFSSMVKNSLAAMLMALLLLVVLRPAVRALTTRAAGGAAPAPGAGPGDESDFPMLESDRVSLSGSGADMLPAPPRVYGDILNLAREMAADDPKRVATVLRKWMSNDE
jgi:flagellar M-ring protein FliF